VQPIPGKKGSRSVRTDHVIPPAPQGDYVLDVLHDGVVYTAGMTPRRNGQLTIRGVVGSTVCVSDARAAARLAAINALAVARSVLADDAAALPRSNTPPPSAACSGAARRGPGNPAGPTRPRWPPRGPAQRPKPQSRPPRLAACRPTPPRRGPDPPRRPTSPAPTRRPARPNAASSARGSTAANSARSNMRAMLHASAAR
jgi:hypothetical protein